MKAQLRDYTRGLRSQEEVARELGISVRTLQRIEDEALAYYLLGIARALREAVGDFDNSPTEDPAFLHPSCRIAENVGESAEGDLARRIAASPHGSSGDSFSGVERRAGLPSRFPRKLR